MGFGLLVGLALFRILIACCALVIRILVVLFFAPIFRPRRHHQKNPNFMFEGKGGKVYLREVRQPGQLRYPVGPNPCKQPAAPRQAAAPRQQYADVEAPRNQVDTAIALKSLGTPKLEAERLAAQAYQELGPTTPLNALIKRALQLADRTN